MIAILSHDAHSATALAQRLELRPQLFRRVHGPTDVYGLSQGDTLLLWGFWWKTHEHREALAEARLRKLLILEVNDDQSR